MHRSRNRVDPLASAYEQCRQLARSTARNFYYSFMVLPKPKRWAMYAVYAFMRRTDDIGDGRADVEVKRAALDDWRQSLDDALAGRPARENWWLALADTVHRYDITAERLHDVVDGVASDLDVHRYATFQDLYRYCYRVASAVGLVCIRIWDAHDRRAELPAEWCGIAFQLTNVLRDIVEDYDRGRLYLPLEDLEQFGVTEAMIANRQRTPELDALLRFQIDRARDYYAKSRELHQYLPASGRAILGVMQGLYGGLLDKIAEAPAQVLDGRISLSLRQKLGFVIQSLPVRYFGSARPLTLPT